MNTLFIVIGNSCSGKSSFVKNSFLNCDYQEKKEILNICETDETIVLGKYNTGKRRRGTDTIARQNIKFMYDQIEKSIKIKDVVIEGTRCINRPLMNKLIELKKEIDFNIKLIYIYCDTEIIFKRNLDCIENDSNIPFKHFNTIRKMCDNFYNEYCDIFDGEIIVSTEIEDFNNFNINNAIKIKKLDNQHTLFDFE